MHTRKESPNKVTGANSRPALQFKSRGLRQRAPVVQSHGRHHGGAAVAQFCRYSPFFSIIVSSRSFAMYSIVGGDIPPRDSSCIKRPPGLQRHAAFNTKSFLTELNSF